MNPKTSDSERRVPVDSSFYDEDYFLHSCSGHEVFEEGEIQGIVPRFDLALTLIGSPRGKYVLDMGCGRGEVASIIARCGGRVVGLDYSNAALVLSQKTCSSHSKSDRNSTLVQADAKAIPLSNESVSFAFMLDVVEHLRSWELELTLTRIWDALRPGGKLIIHTAPNKLRWTVLYPIARFLTRVLFRKKLPRNGRSETDRVVHVNEQTPFSLWWILKRIGFSVRMWTDEPIGQGGVSLEFSRLSGILRLWPLSFLFGFRIWAVAAKRKSTE